MFNPNPVSISDTSTATIDISASVGCSDPNCLSDGDYVMVEIIQDSLGGNFSYRPGNTSEESQTQTVQLKLGDAVTASFQVTAKKGTPAQQYNFIIRVSDVRRGDTSILQNVVLDPPTGGVEERLTVTQ